MFPIFISFESYDKSTQIPNLQWNIAEIREW